MKKRFPAMILALALCIGLAVPACAASQKTYYLEFNAITTAENSEISVSGEDLELTDRIYVEYGLAAGQDAAGKGDESSYPVFTASKPVTVTITADYTDWEQTLDWEGHYVDENYYVYGASVFRALPGVNEGKYPKTSEEPVAYFDGTYAVRQENGGIKENAGTLKDFYMSAHEDWAQIYIYPGATVTLSEPGDYLIDVMIGNRWSSLINFILIHIVEDSSQPAGPSAPPATAFTDVHNWCSAAVGWAVEENITNGTSPTTFSPDNDCTHAEILTFLWRAAGEPTPEGTAPVVVAPYYQDGIDWAYERGFVDDTSFVPSASCTRADAVKYIWLAFNPPDAGTASFTDVSASADYAAAVSWAVSNGITNGDGSEAIFSPDKVCSRAQIVTFLHRAYVEDARLAVK